MDYRKIHFLFHYTAYYLAWLGGITLAAKDMGVASTALVMIVTGMQVLWQINIDRRTQGLWQMVLDLAFMGTMVDSIFTVLGIIQFQANPFAPLMSPPWMIALWVNFAVVYYAVMSRLWSRYVLLGVGSLVSFPLVYWAGARMGAASFPHGDLSALLYGIVWMFLMPLSSFFYERQGICHEC